MMLRKPTIPERVQLTRDAARFIVEQVAKSDSTSPYEIAYRCLGEVMWLHPQSRDGIAAMAASCWRAGVEPYAEFGAEDLEAAERQLKLQSETGKACDPRACENWR